MVYKVLSAIGMITAVLGVIFFVASNVSKRDNLSKIAIVLFSIGVFLLIILLILIYNRS